MMRILKLAVLLVISIQGAFCATFCAVRVLVTDEAGRPATALVKLVESSGKVVQQAISDKGQVEFCDFGFGDYSIDIGGSTCAHIIIPHIAVLFGRSQVFRVYRNQCLIGDVSLIGCSTYFRVTASSGKGLPSVSLTSSPPGVHSETDEYGRARINIDLYDSRVIVFSKAGFGSERLELSCSKPEYAERSVTLSTVER